MIFRNLINQKVKNIKHLENKRYNVGKELPENDKEEEQHQEKVFKTLLLT